MPMIDFALIRQNVSLEEVLSLLGYQSPGRFGRVGYGPCPFSCEESRLKRGRTRCCSFEFSLNLWKCHRCKRGGNQLDLYRLKHGLDLYPAAIKLCDEARIEVPTI